MTDTMTAVRRVHGVSDMVYRSHYVTAVDGRTIRTGCGRTMDTGAWRVIVRDDVRPSCMVCRGNMDTMSRRTR